MSLWSIVLLALGLIAAGTSAIFVYILIRRPWERAGIPLVVRAISASIVAVLAFVGAVADPSGWPIYMLAAVVLLDGLIRTIWHRTRGAR